MRATTCILITLLTATLAFAQGPRRSRGEGMYQFSNSNTEGVGNWWVTLRGTGFIWANKILDTTKADNIDKPGIFPFGEITTGTGITNFTSFFLESRVLSYTWDNWFQFGSIALGGKVTLPNNKELRFQGHGLMVKYIWNNAINFPSLAGFRAGATGFTPEGYLVEGGNLEIKYLNDYDFLALLSWLPLKAGFNAGVRIPFKKAEYVFPQYLFCANISFFGLGYDFYAEYSIEALNNISAPKQIVGLSSVSTKKIEIAFSENPMYLTLGGRIRYDNGVALSLCVPFLISSNSGSAMTKEDLTALNRSGSPGTPFYEEKQRGITDPFDPWFAKWKIVAEISFPVLYKQTGSEMMRNFLLLKGSPKGKKFDIDEQLKRSNTQADSVVNAEQEKKKRLDDIKRRREQIEKNE
jgi:hypothetical protein